MSIKNLKSIEVIFKRPFYQGLVNLFLPKAKRHPRVVTFEGFTGYALNDAGLVVGFGKSRYFYPHQVIGRVKFVQHED